MDKSSDKGTSNSSLNQQGSGKFSKIVNELGKRMKSRQEPQEIISKPIPNKENDLTNPKIPPTTTSASLEKEKTHDHLNRRLSLNARPSKTDLKLKNILRSDSTEGLSSSNPTINSNKSFDTRANNLKSCLRRRPEKEKLEQLGIIRAGVSDPNIAAVQQARRRSQIENNLEEQLRHRPAPEEVSRLLNFSEVVEVLPTFRKSEYNRKPDTNATFKKLTPQMKVEIREELNSFKKTEMSIHELSSSNTCFH